MPSVDLAELVRDANAIMRRWRERWLGMEGEGYSDAAEAVLDVDALVQELEGVRARWHESGPSADTGEDHRRVGETLDELIERMRELLKALDARDFERLRMLSKAVELSAQQLAHLEAAGAN